MGSPQFAVPSLERLLAAGQEITLVVTQPDRPAGRRQQLRPSAIAQVARARGLPLYQPESLKPAEAVEPLRTAAADVIVVAAFGLYLPTSVLKLPRRGATNVHPSLLPRHRGAAPIQAAILAGDQETGVTIMEVAARMDAGPIIAQRRTPILPSDDTPALDERLALMGAELLVETLEPWANGEIVAAPQDEPLATYTPRINREEAQLDWREPAQTLWRKVRAYRGWPDAYTHWQGRLLKILQAEPMAQAPGGGEPGQVYAWTEAPTGPAWPAVATGAGSLLLRLLVLEGKRASSGDTFMRGYPGLVGTTLG